MAVEELKEKGERSHRVIAAQSSPKDMNEILPKGKLKKADPLAKWTRVGVGMKRNVWPACQSGRLAHLPQKVGDS